MKLTDAQKAARATRKVIRKLAQEPIKCLPSRCPARLWHGESGKCPDCECGQCDMEQERTVIIGEAGPQDLMEEGGMAFKDIIYNPTGQDWKRRLQR